MRIQDYLTTSSSASAATRRNVSSSASFQDVLDNAADRFCSKLSDTPVNRSNAESPSAMATKIAEIQAAIEEANAKSGYVVPGASSQASSTTQNSGISSGQASASTTGVYNEGSLCCSDELNAYFLEAAETYNIDVKFLKSVAFVESSFRANATSKCGAMGIMQLMPSAAKQYGAEDPYDARQNIMAGAKILSTFLNRYDGSKELTLAAYNAGPGNVKKAGGVPSYTEGYVNKVLKYYNS